MQRQTKKRKISTYGSDNWDQYNLEAAEGSYALIWVDPQHEYEVISYTHQIFASCGLYQYLNKPCERILQLGASDGRYISYYQKIGWNTIGYEFSSIAINQLKKKGITARNIDLDSRDASGLTYQKQLEKDISKPINIFMIRILQYLDSESVKLLLFFLMEKAAPGSVYFFSGNVELKPEPKKSYSAKTTGYVAGFFYARKDMKVLVHRYANTNDEVLVAVKLKTPKI